jgi:NTP pyrophosphatase (non-canonical NTP hydrolase)
MEFKEIQNAMYATYVKNGYLDLWTIATASCIYFQKFLNLAEAGLIHTEVSELQEDLRSGEKKGEMALECADIVIRVMNFCSRLGLDLEKAIVIKNVENLAREKLHGRVI